MLSIVLTLVFLQGERRVSFNSPLMWTLPQVKSLSWGCYWWFQSSSELGIKNKNKQNSGFCSVLQLLAFPELPPSELQLHEGRACLLYLITGLSPVPWKWAWYIVSAQEILLQKGMNEVANEEECCEADARGLESEQPSICVTVFPCLLWQPLKYVKTSVLFCLIRTFV